MLRVIIVIIEEILLLLIAWLTAIQVVQSNMQINR